MAAPNPENRPNLYLVGFMGTGKSAVGRQLAGRLGMLFIDSDQQIERQQGRAISRIFEEDGESTFRRMEREFLEEGHPRRGCVVSCGGGMVTGEGMVERLRAAGVVVCFVASPETILERTSRNQNRPLLQVDDPMARIRTLLAERQPLYDAVGPSVSNEHRPVRDVVAHVERLYRERAGRFEQG